MSRACPLCTGFLSWKAKTASAPISLKRSRSSAGVSLDVYVGNGKKIVGFFRIWEDTIVLFFGEMFAKNVGRGHHGKTVFVNKKDQGIAGTSFPGAYKY